MQNNVLIKEIFESIQGEGPYIGFNQLFIRFSNCNLNCAYCDTDFKTNLTAYSKESLVEEVKKYKNIHSLSLTGGEPLLNSDFLAEFLPLTDKKIYLETNGTLYKELEKISDYIDIISADIKLNSCSLNGDLFNEHEKFVKTAKEKNKEIFLKVVFNEKITDEEITKTIEIAKKYNIEIILQPETKNDKINVSNFCMTKIFDKFLSEYKNVRLIAQMHKYINVR